MWNPHILDPGAAFFFFKCSATEITPIAVLLRLCEPRLRSGGVRSWRTIVLVTLLNAPGKETCIEGLADVFLRATRDAKKTTSDPVRSTFTGDSDGATSAKPTKHRTPDVVFTVYDPDSKVDAAFYSVNKLLIFNSMPFLFKFSSASDFFVIVVVEFIRFDSFKSNFARVTVAFVVGRLGSDLSVVFLFTSSNTVGRRVAAVRPAGRARCLSAVMLCWTFNPRGQQPSRAEPSRAELPAAPRTIGSVFYQTDELRFVRSIQNPNTSFFQLSDFT